MNDFGRQSGEHKNRLSAHILHIFAFRRNQRKQKNGISFRFGALRMIRTSFSV